MLKDATEVWGRMRVVLLEPARQLIRGVSRGRSHERRAEGRRGGDSFEIFAGDGLQNRPGIVSVLP
jgi:hypothetical protein